MEYNIAIDGPAGAGKSTIAKRVAKELGYIYVDTGAMYRAMAVFFLKKGIRPEETDQIQKTCKNAVVTIAYEDNVQQVYLNGENITSELRKEEVGKMASKSSAVKEVREQLLELQRELAEKENVVMDVCGISCITNMAAGILDKPLTHEEVQETADRVAKAFKQLITGIIREL